MKLSSQAVLLEECRNVEQLLDQTLRHEYGLDGSREFYDECAARLKFISGRIAAAPDNAALANWGYELNQLSKLICRIERSSLGEYSWPFVEELKKIAAAICIEPSLAGQSSKIYVLADGGLDAYQIFPEPKRPSHRRRLLLTIVFPKTLKHFVLLHPILGHELGHAIWRCSKHEQLISKEVIAKFAHTAGVFVDPAATAAHVFSASAPAAVKAQLAQMSLHGINQGNLFQWASWDSWVEEILCDLIGLSTFGPGFVAAQCQLLSSMDPARTGIGPAHPPVVWRLNMILRGASLLGFDAALPQDNPERAAVAQFWANLHANRAEDAWFDVLADTQLKEALQGIAGLLTQYPPSGYAHPSPDVLAALLAQLRRGVPPTGFRLKEDYTPESYKVDFRQIIYAGWIESQQPDSAEFELINRLCEHGIMQQGAIDIARAGKTS